MKIYQDFVEIEMKFPRFTKLQPKRPIGDVVSSRWKKKSYGNWNDYHVFYTVEILANCHQY